MITGGGGGTVVNVIVEGNVAQSPPSGKRFATTGTACEIASKTTFGVPSASDGKQKTSIP